MAWEAASPRRCATSPCSELAEERAGQASVEAAALVPVMALLLMALLQPAIVLYARAVMTQAAQQGVRLLATRGPGTSGSEDACRQFVLRRLEALPQVAAFHVGGEAGWEIVLAGDESKGRASVEVSGALRPLPIVGGLARMLGEPEGQNVRIRVSASGETRPEWLEGSYGDWVSVWG